MILRKGEPCITCSTVHVVQDAITYPCSKQCQGCYCWQNTASISMCCLLSNCRYVWPKIKKDWTVHLATFLIPQTVPPYWSKLWQHWNMLVQLFINSLLAKDHSKGQIYLYNITFFFSPKYSHQTLQSSLSRAANYGVCFRSPKSYQCSKQIPHSSVHRAPSKHFKTSARGCRNSCLWLRNSSSFASCLQHPQHGWACYRQISNLSHTSVGNKIVDHSDVVGASPVGAAPTISSFSTWTPGFNGLGRDKMQDETRYLTHWGLVTPFGDIDLGQHWLR